MNSVGELLKLRARERPDEAFLFFKDRVWTRKELDSTVDAACVELVKAGLKPGERAALHLPNGPEFIINFFAVMKAGGIAVPVNTALKEPEVAHIVNDSGASLVIGVNGMVKREGSSVSAPKGAASIIYTSGTTGFPKGAVLTHANYLFDTQRMAESVKMDDKDRFLCFLPLFHVNAQVVTLLGPLYSGGSMVLMDKFTPKEFLGLLSKHRCTAFSGVPSVYSVLLSLPESDKHDLSSLRFCICGAAPMPVEVFEKFEAKFKAFICEGFGLSEGTCVSSVNPLPPGVRKIGSIGLPIRDQLMRIVDESGNEVPRDAVGEIVIKGENVMWGYWNNPAATASALKDGWLHTGDLGRQDVDGYFFIAGRKKEMIIRGGENIYPKEIEEALYKHAAVAEAAVVGLADKRWGEEVAAFVVLKAGAACGAKEMTAFLRERLADYKVPRRIEFVEGLPKTATGKVQKHRLKEMSSER